MRWGGHPVATAFPPGPLRLGFSARLSSLPFPCGRTLPSAPSVPRISYRGSLPRSASHTPSPQSASLFGRTAGLTPGKQRLPGLRAPPCRPPPARTVPKRRGASGVSARLPSAGLVRGPDSANNPGASGWSAGPRGAGPPDRPRWRLVEVAALSGRSQSGLQPRVARHRQRPLRTAGLPACFRRR